jgi:glycosyltransferase involved in cell wall biosynthesis
MAATYARQGVSEYKTYLAPLFPTAFRPDAVEPSRKRQTGRVLMAGRLTELKGALVAPAAVARASQLLERRLTLVVAGAGVAAQALAASARDLDVPVEFSDWLSPEQLAVAMRNADVLLFPSLWPEPFGLIGIEAGCVGLPTAAFDVGGVADWLQPGISGESAPGDRPCSDELASAIVRVLGNSDHWQRLRIGAWNASLRFTPDAHLRTLIPILSSASSFVTPQPCSIA